MASSSRIEKQELGDTKSPLLRHSINQAALKRAREGESRLEPSKKAARSSRKRAENQEAIATYHQAKIQRFIDRVLAVKRGQYDGYTADEFQIDINYLKSQGITLKDIR